MLQQIATTCHRVEGKYPWASNDRPCASCMRTTITLDDDIAAALQCLQKSRDLAMNELISLTSRAKGNEYSPKAYSINIPNKIRVRSDLCIFRLAMTSQKRSRSPMVNHSNDFSRSQG
jgi:hypothetical protein